jgi:hypothetical protein
VNDPVNKFDPSGFSSLVDVVTSNPGWCATAGAMYSYLSIKTALEIQIENLKYEMNQIAGKKCSAASVAKIKNIQQQIENIQKL